jgi:hypothetical protein
MLVSELKRVATLSVWSSEGSWRVETRERRTRKEQGGEGKMERKGKERRKVKRRMIEEREGRNTKRNENPFLPLSNVNFSQRVILSREILRK